MSEPSCNVCGSPLRPRYPEVLDPQTRERFALLECASCGLGHTSPQPSDLSPYYGREYHGGRHGFTARYCTWRRQRFVEAVVGAPGGRKLLDVGCGDGTFLLAARALGWEPSGTELNPHLARGAGLQVFEDVEGAAREAPFGCITLWHSLEHMRDPKALVQRLAGLLAEDGALLIAVPNAEGAAARLFGPHWFHLDVPRHLFHFGERSLARLLEVAGLEVVRRWHQELEMDVFGWAQSALNAVLPDPNVFFYRLTGRPTPAGPSQTALSFALGGALSAAALGPTVATTAAHKGGTLVVAARRTAR